MFKNWKTSLMGLATAILGIAHFINGNHGNGVAEILAGIGLLVAKDNNVTGGTVIQ